jgi:hypothetical protein
VTQNKGRGRDKSQTNTQAERSPAQTVSAPVPALIESAEPKVIYDKPQEYEAIPKNRFARWLYYRAQIVLGVLTFGALVFYAIQWLEYRGTRELENRAYVASKGVVVTQEVDVEGKPAAAVFITCINTGRTPGRNGNILVAFQLRENPPPEDTIVNPPDAPASKILFSPKLIPLDLLEA